MLQLIVQQLGYLRIHVESCPGLGSKVHISPSNIYTNSEQICRKFTIVSIYGTVIIIILIELIILRLLPVEINYEEFERLKSKWKGFFEIINRTRWNIRYINGFGANRYCITSTITHNPPSDFYLNIVCIF